MPPYFFLSVSVRYVIKLVPRVLRMRKTDEDSIILFISRDGIQVGTGRISLIIPAILKLYIFFVIFVCWLLLIPLSGKMT